jgi:hypothetical protein
MKMTEANLNPDSDKPKVMICPPGEAHVDAPARIGELFRKARIGDRNGCSASADRPISIRMARSAMRICWPTTARRSSPLCPIRQRNQPDVEDTAARSCPRAVVGIGTFFRSHGYPPRNGNLRGKSSPKSIYPQGVIADSLKLG